MEGYRGVSARETRGLETQEAGADMENVTLEKPNPGKFFVFHLMPTQKENFLFVSLLRQGHRCDIMKNLQICRSLASCICIKLSSD